MRYGSEHVWLGGRGIRGAVRQWSIRLGVQRAAKGRWWAGRRTQRYRGRRSSVVR